MTYRLAFIRTADGYLKVTASARGAPTPTAIHLNPDVLAAAARLIGMSNEQIYDLKWAAERAWNNDGIDVCCEAIELDQDQLKSLGFIEDWQSGLVGMTQELNKDDTSLSTVLSAWSAARKHIPPTGT
jgi:hypothetical protein